MKYFPSCCPQESEYIKLSSLYMMLGDHNVGVDVFHLVLFSASFNLIFL